MNSKFVRVNKELKEQNNYRNSNKKLKIDNIKDQVSRNNLLFETKEYRLFKLGLTINKIYFRKFRI